MLHQLNSPEGNWYTAGWYNEVLRAADNPVG